SPTVKPLIVLVGMVVPSSRSVPPVPENVAPPVPTAPPFWISSVPPEITVAAAVPPDETISMPPCSTISPVSMIPEATRQIWPLLTTCPIPSLCTPPELCFQYFLPAVPTRLPTVAGHVRGFRIGPGG